MAKIVSEFLVGRETLSIQVADVAKLLFSLAPQVPIGMETDVFSLLTSVQQAWFGKTSSAKVTHQGAQEIHTNSMELVFHYQQNVHLDWSRILLEDASQHQIYAQPDPIITE